MPTLPQQFYEAAVQVLPILILVMAVGELRLRAEPHDGLLGFFFALSILASMLFAELAAFAALASNGNSAANGAIVLLGLLLGCIYLLAEFALILGNEAISEGGRVYSLLPFIVAVISILVVLGGGVLIYLQAR